jgi:carbon-monoxide dehydrogenase large subunit
LHDVAARPLIGTPVHRLEDKPLLTGSGRFVDDIAMPGLLHAVFVRSPHAHALIRGIDTRAAAALPGVHAVLTIEDLGAVLTRRRMSRPSPSGAALDRSWPFVLADGEVSFVGEAVALVIAESRYAAEDAAALVEVDYEVLPAAADLRRAAEPDAPVIRRELASNRLSVSEIRYGDVDAAFADAPHVFRAEFSQHRGSGHPIECRGIVAEWRASEQALAVFASTQKPHDLFHLLVDLLALDENRLRVASADVGGGFGPKLCIYPEDIAVPAAAKLLRRSIKWIEDRREHFVGAVHERDQHWWVEVAVEADGRLRGLRGRLLHDQGAYALQEVNNAYNSAVMVPGVYVLPAYAMEVVVVHTNKVPVSSVRGAGYPQAMFVIERLMDRIARELGLDRAEVRRRNLIAAHQMPYVRPLKTRAAKAIEYDSGDYPACQAAVLAAAGWENFPARQAAARAEGRYIGIGLAHGIKGSGRGPFEFAAVRVSPSGRVSVFTGATALGQGLATALAQICAEELGVRPEHATVVAGDTAAAPLGLGAFASRQLVTAGSSVLLAAKAVAAKARALAAHLLEAAEHDLELRDGQVRVIGAPDLAVGLGELARVLKGAPGYPFPPDLEPGLEARSTFRTDALAYANACHVAEVEVDVETGGVRVLRYVAMQDSGRLINPLIVDGQVRGGVVHGVGNAVLERMGYDEAGQPLTTTFQDYLLATSVEAPPIETFYRESPSPLNPLGVKGAGEVGTIPTAAAVVSAIEDALTPFGVRISEVPVSPQRLVELIASARGRQLG